MTSDIVILKRLGSDELVKVIECASGNSHGARYWTDFKPDMQMYKYPDELLRIGEGNDVELFWRVDCEEVGRISHFESKGGKWDDVEFADVATESEMMYALAWGIADTPRKDKSLRMDLWHAGNDHIRDGRTKELPQVHLDKLKILLGMISEEQPIDRLMKAEVYRELGQFDVSPKTLKNKFEGDFQHIHNWIKELALAGMVQVYEIR
jgi:hypothetical protein